MLLYIVVGWGIRLAMLPVVLRRNFAPGAAIAWIGIVFIHPYIGLALYLVFAESRLGPGRLVHHRALLKLYALGESNVQLPADSATETALMRLAMKVGHWSKQRRTGRGSVVTVRWPAIATSTTV